MTCRIKSMLGFRQIVMLPQDDFWMALAQVMDYVRYDDAGVAKLLPSHVEEAIARIDLNLDQLRVGRLLDDSFLKS
jgi:hypothetical protein